MSLTKHQVQLVQASFEKVVPIADTAAEIFYARLFEYDPSLRRMFTGDMRVQGRKLMAVLKVAVGSLNDLPGLIPVLEQLADRHVKYGVAPEDYTPVGNALLYALRQGLGSGFTPEVRQAWVDLYRLVANTMRQHSYPGFDARTFRNRRRYNRGRAA